MTMKHIILGALCLSALVPTLALKATTAVHLSDFGVVEEPQVIWHVSSKTFTSDGGFQNITEVTPGTFQMLLNWSTSQWTGDRSTTNNDRGRAEVQTLGPYQKTHETSLYTTTWRTNPQFKGSGRFCHITQLKSVDGVEKESGAPMITTSIGSGTSSAVVQYCSTNFSPANVFSPKPVRSVTWHPNTWLAEQIKVTTTADGEKTGQVVVSLNGDAFQGVTKVEVSRPQSTMYYPKWGLYRKQETTSGFSPSDYVQHSNVSATNLSGPSQAAAPVFSPAAGTYASAQTVTISSSTSGASIRYTTDASTPSETAGTLYSGPVYVSSSLTLKAIAYASGFADSDVTSGAYTISAAPPPTLNFEAESLSYTGSGATTSVQTDTNSSSGKWVELAGNSTGDNISFTVPNVPAGAYQLKMEWKGNNSRGILQLSVDGTNLGSTLDQYSSGQTYPTTTFGNVTFSSAGNHTVKLTVTGRNSKSSSYQLSADKFTFVGQ
ncbi:MAG TPA: chitobiase/beta-hexosaminidase C-terminal domain-containing protein [Opitutaceae bacterium]|nr:chitobiase/beta-hexosaminidase C-terminal domain-containing protein [Opitutaceae bacterium]